MPPDHRAVVGACRSGSLARCRRGYIYLGNRVVIWAAYDFGLTSVSPDGTAKLGISLAF